MQEKESVNFFYYLNPIQIKKYQKEKVIKNKKTVELPIKDFLIKELIDT